MLWIDKIIFGELKTPLHFGIELYSLPAILVGIMYGPLTGFLFGFFILPIIGGIFDVFYTFFVGGVLLDTAWEPFFPSPESFISGIIAIIAGVLNPLLPFFYIVVICILARFFMSIGKDIIFGMPTNIFAYLINFGLNVLIAFNLKSFFIQILI